MLDFDPSDMTDAEIDQRLAVEYPPEDFIVAWWWVLPEERRGFCINVALRHTIYVEDLMAPSTP